MYGTEVKFDTLTDTDWTGTEYQHLLAGICLDCFILSAIYTVVIWCGSFKLGCTGIYHLIRSYDTIIITHLLDLFHALSCQAGNNRIREFNSLCFA